MGDLYGELSHSHFDWSSEWNYRSDREEIRQRTMDATHRLRKCHIVAPVRR